MNEVIGKMLAPLNCGSLQLVPYAVIDGKNESAEVSACAGRPERGNLRLTLEKSGRFSERFSFQFEGDQFRCRREFRNTSGETQGYATRLVSPEMDISLDKVYRPIMVFWYANPKWTSDRDTLRVLYKTGPNAQWKKLAEYSKAKANWEKVQLELPEPGSTYQIAFEGKVIEIVEEGLSLIHGSAVCLFKELVLSGKIPLSLDRPLNFMDPLAKEA